MISNACNAGFELPAEQAVDSAAPGRRGTAQTTAGAAGRAARTTTPSPTGSPRAVDADDSITAERSSAASSIALLRHALAACGGGHRTRSAIPPTVSNPLNDQGSQHLVVRVLPEVHQPDLPRAAADPGQRLDSTNTCAGAGCHDTVTGTGGALPRRPGAQPVDLTRPGQHARRDPRQRHVQELLFGAGRGRRRQHRRRAACSPSRCCSTCCTAAA